MSRVPGTFANENRREYRLELSFNPNWTAEDIAKAQRGEIVSHCHDKTPSLDLCCPGCGATSHMHQSQFEAAAPGSSIAARCHVCGARLIVDRDDALVGLRKLYGSKATT